MQHTIFLAPTEPDTGLTTISLGLIHALDRMGLKVGFCKPISALSPGERYGRSVELISNTLGREFPRTISLKLAQRRVSKGDKDQLMEDVIAIHRAAAEDTDVVIVEGLEPDRSEHFTAKLNVEMAKTLDAEICMITAPGNRSPEQLKEHVEISASSFGGIGYKKLLGVIINKINAPLNPLRVLPSGERVYEAPAASQMTELLLDKYNLFEDSNFKTLGLIPWNQGLVAPRTKDVVGHLNAQIIREGDLENRRVRKISLCARTVPNMINALEADSLIVTPGDRTDVIIATAMAASNGVPLAGLLLTGGWQPEDSVMELCQQAWQAGLPVFSVDTDSYQTASQLVSVNPTIMADDRERAEMIMEHVADHVEAEWLKELCATDHEIRLSPAAFRYQLVQLSQQANKRIVLPEGDEPRTIQAAAICQERGMARCVLLGNEEAIKQVAHTHNIQLPDGLEILDPEVHRQTYIEPMVELRKHKNLTAPQAEALLEDTVVMGTMMLAMDHVDGLVSGAVHTTANTIRPALQLIKTAEGSKIVSSVFFMCLPEQVLCYGDCAVNPDPNAEELADIAIQSADSAKAFGIEPRVAMISYSTGSSGSGADVEKVRAATELAKSKRPDLIIDGPLQYDAATTLNVAKSKAPDSPVAGRATVLVFPDLNTGNTTYKAVQRSANVISIGPMLQGLKKPVNDLSRGALVEDIVYTIALTAIQASAIDQN